MTGYTDKHAASGIQDKLPGIATSTNQSKGRGFGIEIECPELTSVCPETGLPYFGTLVPKYQPSDLWVELESFNLYLLASSNLGVFQESVVNRVLDDVVAVSSSVSPTVKGHFEAGGGLTSRITATHRECAFP